MALLAILLVTLTANAQDYEIFYYAKLPKAELNEAKTKLQGLINRYNDMGQPKTTSILDNRIEMTFKGKKNSMLVESIYFSDLFGYPIVVLKLASTPERDDSGAEVSFLNYGIGLKKCFLNHLAGFSNKLNVSAIESNYKELADYLFYFQHLYAVQLYDSLLNDFKPLAAQYCALKAKPPISEEQRKYIVQANIFTEQKMYEKAIELYYKAIESDQTSYPSAYSNLALLSAQINQFDVAIYYMKKYLLLEPEASDARSAQDKIYEWEILMQK